MLAAFIAELVVMALLLVWLLHRYASKSVPLVIQFVVLLSWAISFSAFIAMSADVYNVMKADMLGSLDSLLKTYWQGFYWLSFLLSMFIVPFCIYYMDSGELTVVRRIKDAVFLLFYYSAGAMVIPGLLLFIWVRNGTLNEVNTPQFIIASTNSYGMLLVIVFMGYGLIKVPMNSWSGRSIEHDLNYCYFDTSKSLALKEKLYEQLEEKYAVL